MKRALTISFVLILGGVLLTTPFVESPRGGEQRKPIHNVAYSSKVGETPRTVQIEEHAKIPTFEEGKAILAEKYTSSALCTLLGNTSIEACQEQYWTSVALRTTNTLYCKALSSPHAFTFCLVETKRREAHLLTERNTP